LKYNYLLIALFFLFSCSSNQDEDVQKTESVDVLSNVDVFIGTADHGHVYPGATVPFGFVQLSPDNGTQGWDWCSGYNYIDSTIVGFSHTHLSGTGIGDLADISIMPANGRVDLEKEIKDHKEEDFASSFSHDSEVAGPGYYSVYLENPKTKAELTATSHTGVHRYSFDADVEEPSIVLNLAFAINWDSPIAAELHMEDQTTVSGYRHSKGWAPDQRLFYVAEFSREISRVVSVVDGEETDDDQIKGTAIKSQLFFAKSDEPLEIRVGLSTASVEGARAAIRQELDGKDFEQVVQNAKDIWESHLSRMTSTSYNEEYERVFTTSLYRTMLAPIVYSDVNGEYKGVDSAYHKADYTRYDIFSLWDTFRAANPLLTITQPERINDMINSMLAHYDEYGLLPVWALHGNETNTMTGYHAIPVIVDAYFKGFKGFDAEKAFEAMKASAMQDIRGTNFYREYGYIPYDKEGQSVTKTLEYAFDDWCIAQMAKSLGKQEDYKLFSERALNFVNMFDSSTGFMRAKYSNGEWKTPFDPKYSSHDFSVAEYTEGNAWQHSWFVPHNPKKLIELHGGDKAFVVKLDSLFEVSSEITGDFVSSDISGLVGQYAHGNEPSHHIAYMYTYAGAPWKTQERVNEILTTMYNDRPTGLCGNEDCGQMSAWYVFSAMGFYPQNPVQGVYVMGSPLMETTTISVNNNKQFKVKASNLDKDNIYIQEVILNGESVDRLYITHDEIMDGGSLELVMGMEPNKTLGVSQESRPPYEIVTER